MESHERCEKLREELGDLKELRLQIGRAYNLALDTRNFSVCGDLRQRIGKILEGSESEISKLRENMVSPELKKLKLKEQYESQVKVAWKSGLFGEEQLHVQPAIERGDQKYPMPTWKEVQKALRKNKEIIEEKSAQGFTKMLIVPFGYDLKMMAEKFKVKVKDLDRAGLKPDGSDNPNKGIFGAGGEKVDFDRTESDYPVWVWEGWDESELVYYPKKYDKENHGGLTKEEAIKINGAWQICFVEDLSIIPLDGKEVGGRRQIDRKGSCIKGQKGTPSIQQFKEMMDEKQKLINPEKYKNEQGMTPEKYLWMQLTFLLAKEKPVLMDYENNEWRGTYLTECFNVSSLYVPIADWGRSDRQFYLDRDNPVNRDGTYGARPSVNIK